MHVAVAIIADRDFPVAHVMSRGVSNASSGKLGELLEELTE